MNNRMLVLENGKVFYGEGFGVDETRIAEISFNTSMVGYQEILSDPANYGNMIVMSYPLIGNYGMADDDYESDALNISALVVREYNDIPSNFRFTKTLNEVMCESGVVGICGVDTREIIRIIREEGTMKAMITDANCCIDACVNDIQMATLVDNPIDKVSSKKAWHSRTRNPKFNLVAVDCGITTSIVKRFNRYGCNVIIVPYNTSVEKIKEYNPDGLFISNGPNNPIDLIEVINMVNAFKGIIPILGIGTGFQIICLAYGGEVFKMKFGHNGSNQPVKNLINNKVELTTQNHIYAVDKKSLKDKNLKITHINILDNDIEGVLDKENKVIGFQYYPSNSILPEDSVCNFEMFIDFLTEAGGNKNAQKNRY